MTEQFYIGQAFEGAYPPEAAIYCNENGLMIEPDGENFVIKQAPVYEPTYAELRAAEYPDYREYLDGIVKNDTAQIDKYIADCLAVKLKYPKA
jgi:hypothetical protein